MTRGFQNCSAEPGSLLAQNPAMERIRAMAFHPLGLSFARNNQDYLLPKSHLQLMGREDIPIHPPTGLLQGVILWAQVRWLFLLRIAPFFLEHVALLSLSFSEGWLCKMLDSHLKEQSVWFLPPITAAGGDEQEREKSLWSPKLTQRVSRWRLSGKVGE